MNRLIILKGASNVGKTSTLDALIKKLLSKDAYLILSEKREDITSFVICGLEGHKVGIITFGDPTSEPDMEGCLQQCNEHQCDIIFAASRTRGNIYDKLYHFAKTNNFATIETSPLYAWNYAETGINIDTLNDILAEMLITLI
jgi:GTPase SAR1 family protein